MLFPPMPFAPAPLNVISQKCGAIGWPAAVQLEFGTPGPVQYGASVEVFMSDELLLIRFMSAPLRMEIPSPLLPMTVLLVTSFLLATPISDNPPSICSVDSFSGPGVLVVVLQPVPIHEFWPLSTMRLFRILFLDEIPGVQAYARLGLVRSFAHTTMPWLS